MDGCLARARKLRPQLAAGWWRAHERWVLDLERRLPAAERPSLRYTISRIVDEKAWRAALRLADDPRCGARVTLSAVEFGIAPEG